ncbi:hypothetical protein ABZZ20_05510 [Streptomyces sp. NPDC006430]|uniref:hypothetical protein n=1 Tax=Streptomyces sp. NPDC006430 TaxID=3154299 RepID=UPI00339FBDA2
MFIRPVGVTVRSANRPAGRPLLRGLLSRAAGAPPPGAADSGDRAPAGPAAPAVPAAPTAEADTAAPQEPASWAGPPPSGLAAELAQLADLAREGSLTPQEFTAAKTLLLHL